MLNFVNDICDGLDYLGSELCVVDLQEGILGRSEKNQKTFRDLHLLQLSETPGLKNCTG